MIGRNDVLFESSSPFELAIEAIKIIRLSWTHAIAEATFTGESLDKAMLGLASVPDQIFVYRDEAAKQSWEEHGAIPQNQHSMVHLAIDEDTLAVVVDDPSEKQTAAFLSSILQVGLDLRQLRLEAV